jgi:DNA-binding Lrp family transcriptional regulator
MEVDCMNELELFRAVGLTEYQSRLYSALRHEGGLSPSEIARRSGVPQSKIYETVYSLEQQGLVKRHLNKEELREFHDKVNGFITEMKHHHISVRIYGFGRVKQVWSTNGVSVSTLLDKKIKALEEVSKEVRAYENALSVHDRRIQ